MARVTAYAESLGDSTSTSSTLATKVSVTFTPNANKTYAYLYSCGVQNNSTSGFAEVELNNTTDAVELYQITPRIVKDAADFMVRGGVAYESYGSSPGSKTIALQYNQQNTGTATIRNARLVVIELDADDKFVYNTDVFTSSASYSTVSQITFTPGSTGDYLILASGNYWSDGTGLIGNCRMYVNGSTYGAYSRSTTGGDHENTWATGFKLASASGAQDYRIELNSNGTNNTGMFHGYMVAFRLDKFGANYYQEDRGRSTYSTDTTYQTKTTLTQTPANVEHIVLAGFILDHASTSNSALGKLVETSTDILVSDEEPQSTSSSNKIAYFAAYRKTLAASSTSWTNQYATETSATVTGIYESWIAILQTADSATNVNANPTGVAGTGAVGTPSITGTAVVNPTGVAGTGSPGTVAVQISVAPAMTGLAATGGVGSLTITGTAQCSLWAWLVRAR